ncbi:MAG: helix-turn-helix domain-containing protein [Christensenellales bacterium]|jgi:transcriptional regulator with XRE-family HTH domain
MISKEEYAGKATTLRELRLQAGKSCIEVANKLGVAVSTLYNYEQGARQIGLDKIIPLAELLGVSEREVIEAQLNSIAVG